MCGHWWWWSWKNFIDHHLLLWWIPNRGCPRRFWQLRSASESWRSDNPSELLGHRWRRGLPHTDYPGTDIFLVCFSVAEPASLKSVKEYWFPEMRHHCPVTPFILLGTKVDLRGDRATLDKLAKKQEKLVSKEEGKRMAESLKAATYLECSALTREGVKNLFDDAIRQTATWQRNTGGKKKSEKKKCNLLRSSSIQFFKKKDIQIKLCFVLLLPAGNYWL